MTERTDSGRQEPSVLPVLALAFAVLAAIACLLRYSEKYTAANADSYATLEMAANASPGGRAMLAHYLRAHPKLTIADVNEIKSELDAAATAARSERDAAAAASIRERLLRADDATRPAGQQIEKKQGND